MKKRNKILLIVAGVFIALAIAFLIVGFTLAGENILAWFTSKWALLFYSAFSVYAIVVIAIVAGDLIKRI